MGKKDKLRKVASESLLAAEVREVLNEYCAMANELRERDMIVSFSITNGTDGKPVAVQSFQVTKNIRLPGEVVKQDNSEVQG